MLVLATWSSSVLVSSSCQSCFAWARICELNVVNMQVAEAQARLEHNKQYIAFLQHQIDIKVARAARQKSQEDEARPALSPPSVACNVMFAVAVHCYTMATVLTSHETTWHALLACAECCQSMLSAADACQRLSLHTCYDDEQNHSLTCLQCCRRMRREGT